MSAHSKWAQNFCPMREGHTEVDPYTVICKLLPPVVRKAHAGEGWMVLRGVRDNRHLRVGVYEESMSRSMVKNGE